MLLGGASSPSTCQCDIPFRSPQGGSAFFRRYRWQVRLPQGSVQGDLEKLVELGHIQKRSPKTDGVIV